MSVAGDDGVYRNSFSGLSLTYPFPRNREEEEKGEERETGNGSPLRRFFYAIKFINL